jgi:hypothetical protein
MAHPIEDIIGDYRGFAAEQPDHGTAPRIAW